MIIHKQIFSFELFLIKIGILAVLFLSSVSGILPNGKSEKLPKKFDQNMTNSDFLEHKIKLKICRKLDQIIPKKISKIGSKIIPKRLSKIRPKIISKKNSKIGPKIIPKLGQKLSQKNFSNWAKNYHQNFQNWTR